MTSLNQALQTLESNFAKHMEDLSELVKIPCVSFPDFDHKHIEDGAEATAALFKKSGLENIQIFKAGKSFPYVYADHCHAGKDKPTLLLYAHYDVQPPGREDLWHSSPFVPTLRDGPGGQRLYARGTADDKGGILIHASAIQSWLESTKQLPVNVKLLIEGEEEIGSPYLKNCLADHYDLIKSDIMVLTDTANYDCGVPSLTVSLRGMLAFEVELRSLKGTVHSGFWGGAVPDPAMALSKLLAKLVDDNGEIAIQEILDLVPPLSKDVAKIYEHLPFDETKFCDQAGLVDGVHMHKFLPHPMQQVWHHPSVAINAIQSSSRLQAGNTINDIAWARVNFRLPPGMDADQVAQVFETFVRENTPWNLQFSIVNKSKGSGWSTNPFGKHKSIFDRAMQALRDGYQADPVFAGCGASIPFVRPFSEALNGAPALLVGIEDPYTNAHGENESLLVSDFEKACRSQVILFEALGGV